MMRSNLRRLLSVLAIVVIFLLLGRKLSTGGGGGGWLVGDEGIGRVATSGGYENEMRRENRSGGGGGGRRAYAPGSYMAARRAGNHSYCKWYYGLPISLEYPAEKLTASPQAANNRDDEGAAAAAAAYRVLPYVIRAADNTGRDDELPNLALCTHATADQVYHVVELVTRWEGPLSLAVFAPGRDAGLAVALLERACRCEPQMAKVTVHLVFPAERPPVWVSATPAAGDCTASDLLVGESETERIKYGMRYPINVARNVARTLSPVRRVLVSDIELLPSERLASGFIAMIDGRVPRTEVVFVLPIFEIDRHEIPPKTKRELVAAVQNGLASYFHRFVCIHCQRFPGITRWMLRPDPGRVRALILTRREYPYHRWEPVFIGTKDDPLYNEDMSWEGRQDKMAQMLEMCLLNYRLIVLDGAFLVHTPGIKYKPAADASRIEMRNESGYARPTRSSLEERRNARIYYNSTRRLLQKYPINRRCGQ